MTGRSIHAPKWLRLAWLPGAILLAALLAVTARYGESKRFAELLGRAKPAWLLVAAVLQIATYVCAALILKLGLRRSGTRGRLRSLIPLGLVKLFVDQAVPTGGIAGTVLMIRALQRRGIPVALSTAAVVVGLLGYYAAYALSVAACLLILWLGSDLKPAVLTLVTVFSLVTAVVPVTLLWLTRGGFRHVPHWIQRIPGLKPVLEAIAHAPQKTLHDRRLLLLAASLQLAIFLFDAATLRALFLALGTRVEIQTVFASFILASMAATITFLPGGVGPFEAGSVATLRVLGVPFEASVAATLLLRGFTLWFPMLPGLWLARREMARA